MIKKTPTYISDTIRVLEEKSKAVDKFYAAKSLAINIGSARIEMLHISKGYFTTKLIAEHSFDNPFSNLMDSKEDADQKFIQGVSYFLEQTDRDWDEVVIGIPRKQLILKVITVPAPERKMIHDILKYEIDKHVPFNSNIAWYDYKILSSLEDNKYKILLSISKNKVIEQYLDLLKRIGLSPTIVDISTSALVNAYMFSLKKSKKNGYGNAILVHRDGSFFEVVLLAHKEILLSRSVQYSIQASYESDPLENEEDPLFAQFLLEEISKTVVNHVHLLQQENKKIPLIFSGIKKTETIESLFNTTSEYTPTYFNGLQGIRRSQGHSIATLGLALRGLIHTHIRFDLLPNSFKRKHNRYAGFITLFLFTTLMLLMPVAGASVYFKELAKLEVIDSLLDDTKEKATSIEKIYTTADDLKERYQSFQDLRNNTVQKLILLKELTTILPDTVWIKTLVIKDKNVELSGFAGRASGIISILEKSVFFTDAKFQGRITKKRNLEKFKLTTTAIQQ